MSDAYQTRYGAFVDAMVGAINVGNSEFAPTIAQASEVKALVCAAVSSVLAGEDTAEHAMKTVAEEINRNVLGIE